MSFQPGVPVPVYATTTVPSGTMMVKVPVPTQVMVSQVVQRPTFMPTIQAQPINHIVTQSAQLIHQVPRPVVSQSQHVLTTSLPMKTQIVESVSNQVAAAAVAAAAASNEPSITVFVGNITDRASDTLIRQILMKCGSVYTWKRVQGASGKLQAFGFCEYKDPESALRAIHILHDYQLGEKKLLVKVDAKTQTQIDEWKSEKGVVKDDMGSDSFKLTGVEEARSLLASLMLEYANELSTSKDNEEPTEDDEVLLAHNRECPTVRESNNIEENLDTLDIEDEQKTYISKEIRSFRESQKQQEEKQRLVREDRDKEKVKDKERHRERRDRRASPRKSRNRSSGRRSESRRSENRRSPRRRSPPRRSPVRRRSRTPVRRSRRSPVRSRSPRRRRSPSPSPLNLRFMDNNDDDTDAHEKRRLERKIKEKEAAYQDRLRSHEMRERRKKRDLEKQDEREHRMRKEAEREAKRLREFFADYDDERFDNKFYMGNELTKRRMDREMEVTNDQKDHKKEQEEVDVLRKRLKDEEHPDPDMAIMKAVKATEDIWVPLIAPDTPPPKPLVVDSMEVNSADSSSSSSEDEESADDSPASVNEEVRGSDSSMSAQENNSNSVEVLDMEVKNGNEADVMVVDKSYTNTFKQITENVAPPVPLVKMEFNNNRSSPGTGKAVGTSAAKQDGPNGVPATVIMSSTTSKRQKLIVSDIFNQDEEEDELPKKRKLIPHQYTADEVKESTAASVSIADKKAASINEEKKTLQRALIEKIPTDKEALFDYSIDWSVVDQSLMDNRIQPWITKKIVDYIGEEEPTLVEFICSKIMTKSSPVKIHDDIQMVLDEEAEVFVMKMWRLLIYEIEAKKAGII